MESAGSAMVDFGRFCTGFLVVMGVGMCSPSAKSGGASHPAKLWECAWGSICANMCGCL